MRDGVEHKSSDLPRDEERLVLGSYFLSLLVCRQLLDGGRPLSLLVGSLALVHFVLNRAGLVTARSCCCYRAGLLGRESLSEGDTALVSTALGLIHLRSCAATETGPPLCLSYCLAHSALRGILNSNQKGCNEKRVLGVLEQISVGATLQGTPCGVMRTGKSLFAPAVVVTSKALSWVSSVSQSSGTAVECHHIQPQIRCCLFCAVTVVRRTP